jgi:hypothetical protein
MPIQVRASDGSLQTFPDGTSPDAIRHAMLVYEHQERWGGLGKAVAASVHQTTGSQGGRPVGPSLIGHPGLAESLIPVWGSGREALADLQDRDYVGAALNGGLAVSDIFLGGSFAKALAKGGVYAIKGPIGQAASRQTWKAVRREMGKRGMIGKYVHGHHWAIPNNGWGKAVPDWLKNHPWNIKPLDELVHRRIHGRNRQLGLPKYTPAQRYWFGTPDWSKAGAASVVGHPVGVAKSSLDQKKQRQ